MATTKERILITLTPHTARELTLRAKREKSPRATIAARLMEQALHTPKVWLTEEEADALFRKLHAV